MAVAKAAEAKEKLRKEAEEIPELAQRDGQVIEVLKKVLGRGLLDVDEVKKIARAVVKEMKEQYRGVEVYVPEEEKPVGKVEGHVPEWFDEALQLVKLDIPVYLCGPAGCGKSYGARLIAKALNVRFGFLSLTAGVSESALTGWLVPGDGGKFVYLPALFVSFYKEGGLFMLDEADAADPNVILVMNDAIANGELAIPHNVQEPIIQRHKQFRLIAAGNTMGQGSNRQYIGRSALDGSTLDRFIPILCDYDETIEKTVVEDEELLKWASEIRKKISKHGFRRIMSTRRLKHFALMKKAGFTMKQIEEVYFRGWTEDEKKKMKEAL